MSEIYTSDAFEHVDATEAETGVVKNVKLLGLRSKNRRTYDTDGVRKDAVSKLSGARIFLDHPADPASTRKYSDSFGVVESVEYRPGQGYFGSVKYNPEHPLAKKFAWDVKNVPKTFGMSINGVVKTGARNSDGDVVVESLEQIRSVDVVTRPATAEGIFEEEDMTKVDNSATEAAAAEAIALRAQLKQVQEELESMRKESAAQKERVDVSEAFSLVMAKMPIPADLKKEIIECACQIPAEHRDKLKGIIGKMDPLFTAVDDADFDAAEESESENKPAPRVGTGGRSGKSGYNLLDSLGLKK